MDERLQKALDFSNYRIALFNRKENLKINMNNMLSCAINGGIFKADRELISFITLLINAEKTRVVLIDINGNPIEIIDLPAFLDELLNRYFEATNLYHSEYSKLKNARTVKNVYEFVDD